jgi:oligoribonuclease NrnB/cAMP/cGMP phosphodiesterase (DHH superfamily)
LQLTGGEQIMDLFLTSESKVRLFSHNDLDGIGCGIVAKLAFPDAYVTYCGYDNINEKVKEYILAGEWKGYDMTFITDISVNEEVENLISDNIPCGKVILLDHHATAEHLNKRMWATVEPMGVRGKNSGTNLLYELLCLNGFFYNQIYSDAITAFVEKVRLYDTWEWKGRYEDWDGNKYDDTEASSLNDLLWLYGHKTFERKYVSRIKNLTKCICSEGSWLDMFDGTDKAVLDVDADKKLAYIERKDKQMFTGRLVGKNAGFVFAEQYISELGNALSERHPDLDFIAIIDLGAKRVSYRTIHKHIHLGYEVAKHYGGGGHPQASGSQIDFDSVKLVVPMIFGSKRLTKKLKDLITGKGFIGWISKLVDKFSK